MDMKKYLELDVFDEFGEINYDVVERSISIANSENIGITKDRELFKMIIDKEQNSVASAWISFDGDNYEWDVVVVKEYQGMGVGSYLIDECINEYSEYEEMNSLATMDISVVNDVMVKALEKRGFEITARISDGFYKMSKSKIKDFIKEQKIENKEVLKSLTINNKRKI